MKDAFLHVCHLSHFRELGLDDGFFKDQVRTLLKFFHFRPVRESIRGQEIIVELQVGNLEVFTDRLEANCSELFHVGHHALVNLLVAPPFVVSGYKYLLCKCVPGLRVGCLTYDVVHSVAVSSEVTLDCFVEEPIEIEVTYAVNFFNHLVRINDYLNYKVCARAEFKLSGLPN